MNATSGVSVCSVFVKEEPDYVSIVDSIGSTTTVEQFSKLTASLEMLDPGKGGSFGLNLISKACYVGNTTLVAHLINLFGRETLFLGNMFGMPPLSYAAHCMNVKGGLLCAKLLVGAGAPINLATKDEFFIPELMPVPSGATALWIAAYKTLNIALVKFLLRRGGVVSPSSNELESSLLAKARKAVEIERVLLIGHFKKTGGDSDSPLSTIPLVLFQIIFRKVFL